MGHKYVLLYYYEYDDNGYPIYNVLEYSEKMKATLKYDDLKDWVIDIMLLEKIKEK